MTNNEILFDRLQKIRQIINKYGAENFYVAFSGGLDSVVMSHLIDTAVQNEIPRVYTDTGIELQMIRDFVYEKAQRDKRIQIIKPSQNIKSMLDEFGYPFKSKKHAALLETYQKYKTTEDRIGIQHYLHINTDGVNWSPQNSCPDKLKCQFTPDYPLKISDMCCEMLKEKPALKWARENNKKISIVGLMRAEGGRRMETQCLAFRNNKLVSFHPLAPITKEWEKWYVDKHGVEICAIYKPPYNFIRTGCKGCPFAKNLQSELDTLQEFFPNERKQCEIIWKPVYDEYRRLNYRLKEVKQ